MCPARIVKILVERQNMTGRIVEVLAVLNVAE